MPSVLPKDEVKFALVFNLEKNTGSIPASIKALASNLSFVFNAVSSNGKPDMDRKKTFDCSFKILGPPYRDYRPQ